MFEIVFFIGPPKDRNMDKQAVNNFLKEKGSKIICGGTTISIFERHLGQSSMVDFKSASEGIPAYGKLKEMITCEGSLTLNKLNKNFFKNYDFSDSVSLIKKMIANAGRIKIYWGKGTNPVNGIDKKIIVMNFIRNIKLTGITPDIVEY